MAFEITVLRKKMVDLYVAQVAGPAFFGAVPKKGDELKEIEDPLHGAFKELIVLKEKYGGTYLTGSHFTPADLVVWSTTYFLVSNKLVDLAKDHPVLDKWYNKCAS